MQQSANLPKAGWYDDPIGDITSLRWWDGKGWTTVTATSAELHGEMAPPARVAVPQGVGQVVNPWETATTPVAQPAYVNATASRAEQLFDTEVVKPQHTLKRAKRVDLPTWDEAGWKVTEGLGDMETGNNSVRDEVARRHNLNATSVEELWQPRWMNEQPKPGAPSTATLRNAWQDLPRLQPDWFWFFAVGLYTVIGIVGAGILGYGPAVDFVSRFTA